MFHRLVAASVWGRKGVSAQDWRFRGLVRWVLPLTDVFFAWFGFAGWWYGIATVTEAASSTWQENWSGALFIFAVIALIGVLFPRLWAMELFAKGPLVGLVSVYIVIFIVNGLTGKPLVLATAGVICILVLVPVWRIFDISGNQLRVWRLARKAGRDARKVARNGV